MKTFRFTYADCFVAIVLVFIRAVNNLLLRSVRLRRDMLILLLRVLYAYPKTLTTIHADKTFITKSLEGTEYLFSNTQIPSITRYLQ